MNWREVLKAAATTARHRQENSKPLPSGPRSVADIARGEGAAWAFCVMAQELEYAASLPDHEGLAYVRAWGKHHAKKET